MKISQNIILATIGVSFFLWVISAVQSYAQTWYDSEGRPLVIDGKKVSRKEVKEVVEDKEAIEKREAEKDAADKKIAETEIVSRIVPEQLEIKYELSSAPLYRFYQRPRSYSVYGYGNYGYYGRPAYYYHGPYHHGYYRDNSCYRTGIFLNYRKGGLNIQAEF